VIALAACGGGTEPPPPPPGVLALNVGEGRTLTSAEAAPIEISGGSAGAEFVLVPFSATQSWASTVALELNASQITGVTGPLLPSIAPTREDRIFAERVASAAARSAGRARFDAELRRLERTMFGPRMPAARAARSRRASLSVAGSGSLAPVPVVGDQITYNTERNACQIPSMRTGTVKVISQYAVIVADNDNPAGGFDDTTYANIASQFDTFVRPLIVQNFGAPDDIDENGGRSIIFYTRAVNELTPPGSDGIVGGFFHPRDLFPKVGPDPNSTQDDCPTSNEAEMFYMLVPDPSRGSTGPFTRASVRESTVGVLGHEFQHLINASHKIRNNAENFEEVWLNEGLSHIAEELLFYSASGLAPESNISFNQLVSSQARVDAVNAYQLDNFGRLLEHIETPETSSPYATNDDLSTRGAIWQLLRYAADRSTTPQQTIWRDLARSRELGRTNFTAVLGDFFALARDWAVAQYTDDGISPLATEYQHPSWHYRSIMPRLVNQQTPPPYPLRTRSLVAGTPLSLTLNGGGAAYVRFGVAAGATAVITPTSSGAAPPATVSFTVVRTK
jgi:hypothetical protein